VLLSPWFSLAWGPPPDPGTAAVSALLRLVCFGGSWRTAIRVVDPKEV
jgi:hypothetical protein